MASRRKDALSSKPPPPGTGTRPCTGFFFTNMRGVRLHVRHYLDIPQTAHAPDGKPKATVYFMHGLVYC